MRANYCLWSKIVVIITISSNLLLDKYNNKLLRHIICAFKAYQEG